jgi:hypothetical protein
MALAGTLKDFSLADIFQLIALQKKTGYLTLRSETDVVTVTFLEGSVVGAESLNKRLEDRLGHVLVKTGRISREELAKALEVQKQTLQRLGYILIAEGFVDAQSLRTALTIQMQQTIFRLFRWKNGDYNFEPHDQVEYDRENVPPMSAESILMEGIRMLDEWPIIEKKIPTFDKVFEKIPLPLAPILDTRVDIPAFDEATLSLGGAPKGGGGKGSSDNGPVRLSQEEMAVYQNVNGVFTVQEIIDRSGLNEFETCKALFELLNRQLIRPVMPVQADLPVEAKRRFVPANTLGNIMTPLFWVWVLISVVMLPFHPLDYLPWVDSPAKRDRMALTTKLELQRVAQSIQLYQLRTGRLPQSLEELARSGYLPMRNLEDPYGQRLIFQVTEGGYTLAARGPHGELPEDFTLVSIEPTD